MIIKAENIFKNYGVKPLFKNANIILNESKIGIIGKNGCGKSTFLKILAKEENIDSGEIIVNEKLKFAYLSQDIDEISDITIKQYLKNKNSSEQNYELKALLSKFEINDLEIKIKNLSGGELKKIELAYILSLPSDVLLLDEPTNHLDQKTINWLEKYLKKIKKSIIVISHDRFFLDQICTEILEIDRQNFYLYKGNYSFAKEEKKERYSKIKTADRKIKAKYKEEEKWMQQGAKARSVKSKERIQKFDKLKEYEYLIEEKKLEFTNFSQRLGNKIIEIKNLNYKLNEKIIIEDFSYNFQKKERIGIVGANGVGKSTLLNLLAGYIHQTSGTIEVGETVKIGYFKQKFDEFNNDLTVLEYIKNISNKIVTKNAELNASQILENFLFSKEKQNFKIEKLSGGERKRLYLLSILIEQPNVLLLDEPTNDFDIATLEIMEEMLKEFPGVIIAVSHDRYFLKNTITKIFELSGDGEIKIQNEVDENYLLNINTNNKKKNKEIKKNIKNPVLKMTYQEKKDFENIDEEIEKLEKEIAKIDMDIIQNSQDYKKVNELTTNRNKLAEKLLEKEENWEYLYTLNEKILQEKINNK